MITRYRAWMDGAALDEIADSIYITDIVEPETQVEVISLPLAGSSGSRLQSNHRRSKTVLIRLMIREYDVTARKDVLNDILTWAQGSALKINDRENQVLYVMLDNSPAVSALKWTETLTLSFSAWQVPYWQMETPIIQIAGNVSEQIFRFATDGNVPAPLDFDIVNLGTQGQTVSEVSVSVNDQYSVRFTDLSLQPGETMTYVHDKHGVLIAKIGERSVLGKMTADSDDELLTDVKTQINVVTIRASSVVNIFLYKRWRWM